MMTLIPLIYYSLNRYEYLASIYLAGCITIGFCSITFSMSEKFAQPSYRQLRAFTFSAFGLYGVVPFSHWLLLESHLFESNSNLNRAFSCILTMGFIYLLASCLYATQIPEKLYPGKCDLFLHSHQIFHFLVTIGALVHYHGLINLVDHMRSIKY